MATAGIREQEILDALHQLPVDRWGEVLSFLRSLSAAQQASASGKKPIVTGVDLAGSDLVGIWSDRTDIDDSRDFARQLRQRASHRVIRGKFDAG